MNILVNSDFNYFTGHTTLFTKLLCALFFTIYKRGELFIKEYSDIFKNEYEIEDTVRIVNTLQAGLYIKHNVSLVDLFWSKDTLVFVFNKNDSKNVYDLWCKHELK